MGLDMYIEMDGETIAYWRKSNQIHGWFARRFPDLENCKEVPITKEDLLRLTSDISVCVNEIIDIGHAGGACKAHLPTTKGFFFGLTDYEEWYVEDLFESLQKVTYCAYKMAKYPDSKFTYTAWW